MPAEPLPVALDELIWRRIPKAFVKPVLPMSIGREAFRPREEDATGLSVFRARFFPGGPAEILRTLPEERRGNYYVAELVVWELAKLGLTVVPEEIDELPGHAVIPELSRPACDANPLQTRELQARLAMLASRALVLRPE